MEYEEAILWKHGQVHGGNMKKLHCGNVDKLHCGNMDKLHCEFVHVNAALWNYRQTAFKTYGQAAL